MENIINLESRMVTGKGTRDMIMYKCKDYSVKIEVNLIFFNSIKITQCCFQNFLLKYIFLQKILLLEKLYRVQYIHMDFLKTFHECFFGCFFGFQL